MKSTSPSLIFKIGLLEFIVKLNYYWIYYFVYLLRKQNSIFCLLFPSLSFNLLCFAMCFSD